MIFCSKCGIKQTVQGDCWDNGKCSKCYNKESMADIQRNVIVIG